MRQKTNTRNVKSLLVCLMRYSTEPEISGGGKLSKFKRKKQKHGAKREDSNLWGSRDVHDLSRLTSQRRALPNRPPPPTPTCAALCGAPFISATSCSSLWFCRTTRANQASQRTHSRQRFEIGGATESRTSQPQQEMSAYDYTSPSAECRHAGIGNNGNDDDDDEDEKTHLLLQIRRVSLGSQRLRRSLVLDAVRVLQLRLLNECWERRDDGMTKVVIRLTLGRHREDLGPPLEQG